MKHNLTIVRTTIFLIFCVYTSTWAQYNYEKVEQVTWGSRVNNPIQIEVIRNNERFDFYVTNNSYFPYNVQLEFKNMLNLQPMLNRTKAVVQPGKSRLLTLTRVNNSSPIDYSYTSRYTMGDPDEKVEADFPYLIPITNGKKVIFFSRSTENGNIKFRNLFLTNSGDTVCAMRKGIVTAVPDNFMDKDRILKNTVEIRHADGSVAIYENINRDSCFVNYGQKVYPGDPIGLIHAGRPLRVSLFQFSEDGRIKSFDFRYVIDESQSISAKELTESVLVKHPKNIIEKEMTKRELKKRDK